MIKNYIIKYYYVTIFYGERITFTSFMIIKPIVYKRNESRYKEREIWYSILILRNEQNLKIKIKIWLWVEQTINKTWKASIFCNILLFACKSSKNKEWK